MPRQSRLADGSTRTSPATARPADDDGRINAASTSIRDARCDDSSRDAVGGRRKPSAASPATATADDAHQRRLRGDPDAPSARADVRPRAPTAPPAGRVTARAAPAAARAAVRERARLRTPHRLVDRRDRPRRPGLPRLARASVAEGRPYLDEIDAVLRRDRAPPDQRPAAADAAVAALGALSRRAARISRRRRRPRSTSAPVVDERGGGGEVRARLAVAVEVARCAPGSARGRVGHAEPGLRRAAAAPRRPSPRGAGRAPGPPTSSSMATIRSTPSSTARAWRAAIEPIETWSSWLALVGIESTDAGWARTLCSEARAAAVYW